MRAIANAGQRLGRILAPLAAAAGCLTGMPAQADDAAMQAAATSTRARWDAIVASHQTGVSSKAFTPPVINSAAMVNPTLALGAVPLPARIKLDISSQAGLGTVMIDMRSRDYQQGFRREITIPYLHKSGPFVFDTAPFTASNQPGAWDIRFIGVCDVAGQCTNQDFYSQPAVAARTVTVSNSRTPDVTKPQVTSASLSTTALTTHSTGVAPVVMKFGVSDAGTGAGVVGISVCARPDGEAYEVCGYWDLPDAIVSGNQWVSIFFEGNTHTAGNWHIAVVEIVDRTGNNLFVNDPAALDAMFPGGRTFTLTNGT